MEEKQKIINILVKGGFNKEDAEKMVNKQYDYVARVYDYATISKKAEIISALGEE